MLFIDIVSRDLYPSIKSCFDVIVVFSNLIYVFELFSLYFFDFIFEDEIVYI